MICNTIGLTTDSFETLYVHGGAEVPEVYGSINYAQPIFYSLKTLTGATSYIFMGYPEPLKSYEISGNMAQSGTPTPTSSIYPQECGVRTENLLEITDNMKNSTEWVLSPVLNLRYFEVYDIANVVPRGIISANIFENFEPGYTPGLLVFAITPKNTETVDAKYRILTNNGVVTPKTFDTTSWNNVYLCIGYGNGFDSESTKQQKIDELFNNWRIMITASSTPPSHYEPYGYKIPLNLNGTTQNLYLTEPLRKIGDYADGVNSDGTVTRRIKKLVLTGDEPWALWQSGYPDVERYYYKRGMTVSSRSLICTHFQNIDYDGNFQHVRLGGSNNEDLVIFISRTIAPTVADIKSYLAAQYAAGAPVTVWYIPATPTTEQVTVPTLTPATGNNTLAIDTTLQPSSLSITGHIKPASS